MLSGTEAGRVTGGIATTPDGGRTPVRSRNELQIRDRASATGMTTDSRRIPWSSSWDQRVCSPDRCRLAHEDFSAKCQVYLGRAHKSASAVGATAVERSAGMLFNSYAFIAGFLPVCLAAFFILGRLRGGRVALPILIAFSIAFYTYWDWRNLAVLVPHLVVNFAIGRWLTARPRKSVLVLGLAFNLAVLGVFKYADFSIRTVNHATGFGFPLLHLALPLGISFFTFEQIAYIVDAYRGKARLYDFSEYCFFVTFFPHLIAGPIIQHDELLSQSEGARRLTLWKPQADNIALGVALFAVGLFKKVVIADRCAPYVAPYDQIATGVVPSCIEAWVATVGYSLQLYFDFSGYSDMAIGLARVMNLRLPENFASPYKAHNPIDFWRRWHMTLSRFLRVYLYIPLGGNRGTTPRRYFNIFLTMTLGGLWHGAGWGFVLWGAINGIYLVINNAFRSWRGAPKDNEPDGPWWVVELSCGWTFFLIMVSRVFFRAPDLSAATGMLKAMFVPPAGLGHAPSLTPAIISFTALYGVCRFAPNVQQLFAQLEPVVGRVKDRGKIELPLSFGTGVVVAVMAWSAFLMLTRVSEFLYFQF